VLKDDIDWTFAQIGCPSASQLSPDYVNGRRIDATLAKVS